MIVVYLLVAVLSNYASGFQNSLKDSQVIVYTSKKDCDDALKANWSNGQWDGMKCIKVEISVGPT